MARYVQHGYDGFEDELEAFDEYAYDVFQTGAMPRSSQVSSMPKKKSRGKITAVVATILIAGGAVGIWMASGKSTSLLWGPLVSQAHQVHEAETYDEPLVAYSAFGGDSTVQGGVPETEGESVPVEAPTPSQPAAAPISTAISANWNTYYRDRLDARFIPDYDAIFNSIDTMTDHASLPIPLNQSDLECVLDCVRLDHPEVFWLEDEYSCWFENDVCTKVAFTYCASKEERNSDAAQLEAAVASMAAAAADLPNDYEKVRFFYHAVTETTSYDASLPSVYTQTPIGVFLEGVSACAGYSRAVQMACDKANIPCICVFGTAPDSDTGGDGPHAWNAVIADGVTFYMDVTWGDVDESSHFTCDEAYLGLTTADMATTGHIWKYPDMAPICDDPVYEPWILMQTAFGSYNAHDVASAIANRLDMGDLVVYLRFPDRAACDAFMYDFCEEGSAALEIVTKAHVAIGNSDGIAMHARRDNGLNVITYKIE